MLRHCRDFSFTAHHSHFTARSRPALPCKVLPRKVLPCPALQCTDIAANHHWLAQVGVQPATAHAVTGYCRAPKTAPEAQSAAVTFLPFTLSPDDTALSHGPILQLYAVSTCPLLCNINPCCLLLSTCLN